MENSLKTKSLEFAKRIVELYKHLCADKQEYVLSKQVLRSGTSIGANIAEAQCAMSRKDFHAKLSIAYKECAETLYWLELLYSCDYLTEREYRSLHADAQELYKLLSSATKTLKNSNSEE